MNSVELNKVSVQKQIQQKVTKHFVKYNTKSKCGSFTIYEVDLFMFCTLTVCSVDTPDNIRERAQNTISLFTIFLYMCSHLYWTKKKKIHNKINGKTNCENKFTFTLFIYYFFFSTSTLSIVLLCRYNNNTKPYCDEIS